MKKILVCGSIAYDHVMNFSGKFSDQIMPDKLDNLSVSFLVDEKQSHFGGCGGNIAYGLGLLGEESILMSVVGRDFEDYRTHLEENDVNTENIVKMQDQDTASAHIATDKKGNQIMFFHPGASSQTPNFDLNIIKDDISMAIIAPDNGDRMITIAKKCASLHIPFFFDPGQALPNLNKTALMDIVDSAKGIFLNEYELEMMLRMTGLSHNQFVRKVGVLILTLGSKGSQIETDLGKLEIPVYKPKQIKDPTGCGDAYRSGFLKGLKEGFDLKKCGQMGALMATYNVENFGTQNHAFTEEEFYNRLG